MQKKRGNCRVSCGGSRKYSSAPGENLIDLATRANEALKLIESGGGDRCVLVSHGWFLKVFLGNQLGLRPSLAIKQLKFSNAAMSEISLQEGRYLIEYLNNRDYLK